MGIGKKFLKLILIIANAIFALLFILAWIASFISPAKLLFPAYTTLILPLTIAVNISFVFIWVSLRSWNFILPLILLIAFYSLQKSTFPINLFNKNKVEAADFSIMTYNTYANFMMQKHTKDNPNPVIQYILDKDPDIVCIQEYSANFSKYHLSESDLNKIFAKYPYKHVKYKVDTGWSFFGNATFSKYPIIYETTVDYPSAYNSTIASDIDVNGKIIRVFNCHLESNKITENDKDMAYRLKEDFGSENLKNTTLHFSKKLGDAYIIRAKQAEILADSIAKSPYPTVVLGDFNDLPTSYTYNKVKGDMEDAFVNKGFGLGWTFHTRLLKFRIDHVLYDASLQLNQFQLDNKMVDSDHYPLISKFSF